MAENDEQKAIGFQRQGDHHLAKVQVAPVGGLLRKNLIEFKQYIGHNFLRVSWSGSAMDLTYKMPSGTISNRLRSRHQGSPVW